MEYFEVEKLKKMVLAPWIGKAMALIGKRRMVGGNQFRHAMSTMGILFDYKIVDPIILKAAIIHDLKEDIPETNLNELRTLDSDGENVVDLVLEVTIREGETKREFLTRILEKGSEKAKILKIADRISNLTDLHRTIFHDAHYLDYLEDTVDIVIPMADCINGDGTLATNLRKELTDLVINRLNVRRENIITFYKSFVMFLLTQRGRQIYKKLKASKEQASGKSLLLCYA